MHWRQEPKPELNHHAPRDSSDQRSSTPLADFMEFLKMAEPRCQGSVFFRKGGCLGKKTFTGISDRTPE